MKCFSVLVCKCRSSCWSHCELTAQTGVSAVFLQTLAVRLNPSSSHQEPVKKSFQHRNIKTNWSRLSDQASSWWAELPSCWTLPFPIEILKPYYLMLLSEVHLLIICFISIIIFLYISCRWEELVSKSQVKLAPSRSTAQLWLTKEVNIEVCVERRGEISFPLCEAVRWSSRVLDN